MFYYSARKHFTGLAIAALMASVAIGIVILTVSYQAIKAALSNPVTSLRSE
jgi:hypothetical protein